MTGVQTCALPICSFKRLNELYAANGQIGFLASQRVDGMLMLKEAVKALEMKAKG